MQSFLLRREAVGSHYVCAHARTRVLVRHCGFIYICFCERTQKGNIACIDACFSSFSIHIHACVCIYLCIYVCALYDVHGNHSVNT